MLERWREDSRGRGGWFVRPPDALAPGPATAQRRQGPALAPDPAVKDRVVWASPYFTLTFLAALLDAAQPVEPSQVPEYLATKRHLPFLVGLKL